MQSLLKQMIMNDLAILKLDVSFDDIPYAFKEDKEDVAAVISAIGYPLPELTRRYEVKITSGIINSNSGLKDDPRWYQHSASIQQGNSGGPLINEYGNIVGINKLGIDNEILRKKFGTETQNVFYAIKSRYLINLMEDLDLQHLQTNRFKNLINYYFNDFEELYKDIKKYVYIVQAEGKEKDKKKSNLSVNTNSSKEPRLEYNFIFERDENIIIFGKYTTEEEAIEAKKIFTNTFVEFPVEHFYLPDNSNSNEEVYRLYLGPIKGKTNANQWSKLINVKMRF